MNCNVLFYLRWVMNTSLLLWNIFGCSYYCWTVCHNWNKDNWNQSKKMSRFLCLGCSRKYRHPHLGCMKLLSHCFHSALLQTQLFSLDLHDTIDQTLTRKDEWPAVHSQTLPSALCMNDAWHVSGAYMCADVLLRSGLLRIFLCCLFRSSGLWCEGLRCVGAPQAAKRNRLEHLQLRLQQHRWLSISL